MIIGIHQPNYIPWIGYFYKIAKSDVFVLLDNVQFTKNSYINRNHVKTANGSLWLTVPILLKGKFGQLISETQINNKDKTWREKHTKTLFLNYKKANYFNEIFPMLEEIINKAENDCIVSLNICLIKRICEYLKFETELIVASDIVSSQETSTERLITICRSLGATQYLSGKGGATYQDEETFKKSGIELKYTDFVHPIYNQLWGDFQPNLSIVDLLFNCGLESRNIIINSGISDKVL